MFTQRRFTATAVVAALAVFLASCGGGGPIEIDRGTIIQNVTVVDTRDGSLATGRNVVYDGATIRLVTELPLVAIGSAMSIDASGKYLIPGLLDMHTHVFNAPANDAPQVRKLLIANGITGVREMGGSAALVRQAAQSNADLVAGTVDTPEILQIPGQIVGLPGGPAAAPAAAATSAAAATQEAINQKGYGAGFIKVIAGARDAILALIAEGLQQGLGVAGHIPPALKAVDAAAAGWRAVEHLGAGLTVLLDCSSNEDAIRAAVVGGAPVAQFRQQILDTFDAAKCQSMAQAFATNQNWHVPTLIRLRTGLLTDDPQYRNDPNLIYVSAASRAVWEQSAVTYAQNNSVPAKATLRSYYDREQTLPLLFKRQGVKMLAGSDLSISSGITATWVVPGFSLHQEFALLAASGLTPLEILQMTTVNGAEFLGRLSTMGTVEANKNADLVLLDANPIADSANLSRIAGVVLRGKYFSKQALDQLKAEVSQAYAGPAPAMAQAVAASIEDHVD